MTVALLLISDGRHDYLERTLASLTTALGFRSEHELRQSFTGDGNQWVHVRDDDHLLGFAGAIAKGWNQVRTDHVFHVEADFVFSDRMPALGEMIDLLQRQPQLAQVALKRQPWNAEERVAGGIVELHPDDFTERHDDYAVWTEHRRFFTTNPSVYSSRLCRIGWPQEPQSEGMFTHRLLRDPLLRFAFWGAKLDPPRVEHIGAERAGVGY
jgi:hypothetical protein